MNPAPSARPGAFPALAAMVLVALPVVSLAQAPSPASLQALFAEAVAHQQRGEIGAAIEAYERFLAVQPKNVAARSNLGAALAHEGRYEEAIAEYRQALKLDPAQAQVRFNLAAALYKASLVREAAEELQKVVAAKPEHKQAVILLADCHLRLGEANKTIAILEPLGQTEADNRAVAYLLGMAYLKEEKTELAQRWIDRILRDGDSAEAHVMMGQARLLSKEYMAARDDFARAVEINPKLTGAQAFLGRSLMAVGDTPAAAVAFARELALDPNDFEANLFLGVLLKQDHKLDEAMACFKKALSVRPGAVEVLYQIGALQLQLGDAAHALETLEDVVAKAPTFVEAHVSLGTVYYRLKRKADGDREGAIVEDLTRKLQASQPGAQDGLGAAYRGEAAPPDGDRNRSPR